MKTVTKSFLSRNWLMMGLVALLAFGLYTGYVPHANVAFAQVDDSSFGTDPGSAPTGTVKSEFKDAVRGFVNYFLTFLGIISVVFIIYAGVLMVTSAGDEEKTNKGKKILLWAGAGIIVIMLSYAIVRLFVGAGQSVA